MAVSKEHLNRVGSAVATLWDHRDLDSVMGWYREDAVFVSPNPPAFSPEFGTVLNGRDEIRRYFQTTLDVIPAGVVRTRALLTGIDMVVWAYGGDEDVVGADVMFFDDDGFIERQHVTEAPPI